MGIQQEGNAPMYLCLSAEMMCLQIPFHVLCRITIKIHIKGGRTKKGVT